MREWNLKKGDPLSLSLASDARLGSTDYVNDHIWTLALGGGDPPALAVLTTYGLRARSMRLFLRFHEDEHSIMDPDEFNQPPAIRRFYPNYLLVHFAPFPELDVRCEYWVPQSHVICGRVKITNLGKRARNLRIELVSQLNPNEGYIMAPIEVDNVLVLGGQTAGLNPVTFMTGGAVLGAGPFPSLAIDVQSGPSAESGYYWSHATLGDHESSFALARASVVGPWQAEIARLELLNSGSVEIHSGDSDWDAAFALAQKVAYSLFIGPTKHLPNNSIALVRQPDNGFSIRGDGSDYNHLWNGQTPLECYYLSSLILPAGVDIIKGMLLNFIATQLEDGTIDWKPGLAGQRGRLLATPLLVSLAWRIFQVSEDVSIINHVYPALLKFLLAWFRKEHDRDIDGVPEWDHPVQAGFEDHPTFSHAHDWALGINISTVESPALTAFLYKECCTLLKMAELISRSEGVTELKAYSNRLRSALDAAWDPQGRIYRYIDRDSHLCSRGEMIVQSKGAGVIPIQRSFDKPVRLHVRIDAQSEMTRHPRLFIHGAGISGQHRVEQLTETHFRWLLGSANLTGERLYTRIDHLEFQGLEVDDRISVFGTDLRELDQTLLLPLWAEMLTTDRAESLTHRTITRSKSFWRAYGLPGCLRKKASMPAEVCESIHLPWNHLIGEGLLAYGYRTEAAELLSRIMSAVIGCLKTEQCFRQYYHAGTGQGLGERNALTGLAPVGLFLETLGVRFISPHKVILQGFNPFPWPVTVKYRGSTVLRHKDKTTVVFSDGQTVQVTDPAPTIVVLETGQ